MARLCYTRASQNSMRPKNHCPVSQSSSQTELPRVMEFMRRKSTDYVGAGIPWTEHDCSADLDFAMFGLRINAEKSKSMPVGLVGPMGYVTVANMPLVVLISSHTLGALSAGTEIPKQTLTDWKSLCCLSPTAADMVTVDYFSQRQIYIILSTVLYASETWSMSAWVPNKVNSFHHQCLRSILKICNNCTTLQCYQIRNELVQQHSGFDRLDEIVAERRLRLAGHNFPSCGYEPDSTRWQTRM
ncbi:hypothetical protein DPX16_8296 [Anabarilius grahami]|uniref:Reverse transcriptase domain-containing protein n=1 Tax=Anabarilius grahami TaxID=495550 RepID=A0A3N0YG93_ANAGA|nr:hypothetical protein DPX16_8296 [Anabarilius grahami]